MSFFSWWRRKKTPACEWKLSRPLLDWSKSDVWNIREAVEGTLILSATGSGKSSGAAIAKAMLTAGFGGLVPITTSARNSSATRRCAREVDEERRDQPAAAAAALGWAAVFRAAVALDLTPPALWLYHKDSGPRLDLKPRQLFVPHSVKHPQHPPLDVLGQQRRDRRLVDDRDLGTGARTSEEAVIPWLVGRDQFGVAAPIYERSLFPDGPTNRASSSHRAQATALAGARCGWVLAQQISEHRDLPREVRLDLREFSLRDRP